MLKFLAMRRRALALVLATSSVVLTACSDDDDPSGPALKTITQTAAATGNLSTLVTALQAASLTTTLDGTTPYTVFAPVNAAFAAVPPEILARLLETGNRAILTKVLTFHVVPGKLTASQLTNGQVLTTVEGTQLTVSITNGSVRVNGALVTTPDVQASNGVVHLIDGVMLGSLDIVDQATIRGLSSLVSAAGTAGLVATLRGGGTAGLTVFAPTNTAFANIAGGAPTDPAVLSQVLRLHVVGARALSTSLTNGQVVTSALGPSLTVGITGSAIRITGPKNFANVVVTDVAAKNGVIHVIDSVLLP
jgi:transforming growth factor-beta-induced protein